MQNWLFGSGGCERGVDIDRRSRVEFETDGVETYFEETVLSPGLSLYRAAAGGACGFHMKMPEPPPGGRLILGCMLGGRGTISLEGCDEVSWRSDERLYCLTPVDRAVAYDIASAGNWATAAIKLEEPAIDLIATDSGVPRLAFEALEQRRVDVSLMAPLSPAMRALARELINPTYSGPTGRLYLQARALELLARQFELLGGELEREGTLAGPEAARVREARQRLVADLGNPPDLATLAASVGLTPKRLNRGFRELFGATVFEYLRNERLEAAREALEEDPRLSLKQLAWRLGYAETNNFINAFGRRFGISPGAFRDRRTKPN